MPHPRREKLHERGKHVGARPLAFSTQPVPPSPPFPRECRPILAALLRFNRQRTARRALRMPHGAAARVERPASRLVYFANPRKKKRRRTLLIVASSGRPTAFRRGVYTPFLWARRRPKLTREGYARHSLVDLLWSDCESGCSTSVLVTVS